MPCLTRRTRIVVAFMPSTSIGSSAANSGIRVGELAFQFERVERVPPGPLNVLADHRREPGAG
jgi:hypothetical protein